MPDIANGFIYNALPRKKPKPSGTAADYKEAVEVASAYVELGLYEEALAALYRLPVDEIPQATRWVVRALTRSKRYGEAAQEGRWFYGNAVAEAFEAEDAFEVAVAFNACRRHVEAKDYWLFAIESRNLPVDHVGMACELAQLWEVEEALTEYCEAITAGFRPTLYDLADPDLTRVWYYAGTQRLQNLEKKTFALPFWDALIEQSRHQKTLPNQGHSTLRELDPVQRKVMHWDPFLATFVIRHDGSKHGRELARSVEEELWERFHANAGYLEKAVVNARQP